nr:MAG TPA: Large subunit terminase [Caudoviricetes sp.]
MGIEIAPASKPQELFLTLRDGSGKRSKWATEDGEEVDIIFYGGQAGGGKTFASLLHHMKYIHIPYYKGIVIRRTTPMLTKPGAIWDEAKALYKEYDDKARIRNKDMKISFGPVESLEKKAEVSFTHFERVDDTDNFQGSQLSSAVLDELCQFEESQFLYILSRLRTKAEMKPVLRATMNPDPDSWVKKWISYYLYPEGHEFHGRPDPSKQGVVRWFIRDGNDMIWTMSREEMFEKHGRRDSFGNLLPETDKKQIKPLSFAWISASVYDNPFIEDNYIAFLEGLPRIEKEILLYGSWEARPEGSGLVRREWFKEKDQEPAWTEIEKTVRAYDFAFTKKSDLNPFPDYTISVKMSRLKCGDYFIHDIRQTRILPGEWLEFIMQAAVEDGKHVDIIIPIDPGAGAKFANDFLSKQISAAGYYVRQLRAQGKKADRFRPFASMVMNGGMQILKNCATDYENGIYNDLSFFYNQLESFDGSRSTSQRKDDLCDGCADAFEACASTIVIPDFLGSLQMTNLKMDNPFLR